MGLATQNNLDLNQEYISFYKNSLKKALDFFEQFISSNPDILTVVKFFHKAFSSYEDGNNPLHEFLYVYFKQIVEIEDLKANNKYHTLSHLFGALGIEMGNDDQAGTIRAENEIMKSLQDTREIIENGLRRNGNHKLVLELSYSEKFEILDKIIEFLSKYFVELEG